MKVSVANGEVTFDVPFQFNHLAKSCGARYTKSKGWHAKLTRPIAAAILRNFKPNEIDPQIVACVGEVKEIPCLDIDPNSVLKHPLKKRQMQGLLKAWPKPSFAFLWSMGAGKTISSICLAELRFHYGLIDQVLVVCPNAIVNVWPNQWAEHAKIERRFQVLEAGDKIRDPEVLVVSIEALSQGRAPEKVKEFIARGRTMLIVDESSKIKNHKSIRTEVCCEFGQECAFRLILTGTMITKGIEDMYSQFYCLDPAIIGELSYYSFRNKYCVMGGFEQKKIVGYKRVDDLFAMTEPWSDVVEKKDIEGLPPYSFEFRKIAPTPDQVRMSKELKKNMLTEYGDKEIAAENTLEILLRQQEFAGGFYTDEDGNKLPIGKTNPKLNALMDILEEVDEKVIIWARFRHEIDAIRASIEDRYPGSTLELVGGMSRQAKQELEDSFQGDPKKRFLITNQQTGGYGFTFTAATVSVYYSMTFAYEDYKQSLDRNHRIGQDNSVLYIFLVMEMKVDKLLMDSTENKQDLAEFVSNRMRVQDMF